MKKNLFAIFSLIMILIFLSGCVLIGIIRENTKDKKFSYLIDPTISMTDIVLPGIKGGPSRSMEILIGPEGQSDKFVTNEVILHPDNDNDLNDFLEKYQGVILHDGTPLLFPDVASKISTPKSSGWYLIRINPQRSSLEDLVKNMGETGLEGLYIFSSENGARLGALLVREKLSGQNIISANIMVNPTAVEEHPDGMGNYLDAETWWQFTDDDEPDNPGEQGLSTSVIRAWRYLNYKGIPPTNTSWSPPIIAIIDNGFDLDDFGKPISANQDFFQTRPLQLDIVDHDLSAGGKGSIPCGDGNQVCEWHGQEAFGVAAALHSNRFGGAGTSGNLAWPLLVRTDNTSYNLANGIRSAVLNGADVISISAGSTCFSPVICSLEPLVTDSSSDSAYSLLENAVLFATSSRSIIVSSAGNGGFDIGRNHILPNGDVVSLLIAPCELPTVICVGAINSKKENVENWGSSVDIWAPTKIHSTYTPDREEQRGKYAVCCFGGTSASTPFVAGIIALMKAMEPSLTTAQILSILKDTANPSPDEKVDGYIDALRAVQAINPNLPPIATIRIPINGATVSYDREIFFLADVSDPEVDADFSGEVIFTSNLDGELCRTSGYSTGCKSPKLSLGTHQIELRAVDPFDGIATDSITIHSINQDPIAKITYPTNDATYSEEQTINFRGYGSDWDGFLDETNIIWESNLDGNLGSGKDILISLSPGIHTITLTASDDLGLQGQDSITVNVDLGSGNPTALILSPENGFHDFAGSQITFEGQGTDPEDGILSGQSLTWTSDIDGFLGNGAAITTTLSGEACGIKNHTVTLKVVDSNGNETSHSIGVLIGTIC